ncbi:RDD family protein [Actinomadura sp. KC216]|uniref:RDD family protein n=1 Tax=Actinomadura sp. KC216 TaxID=2530370 RepID=UPI001FB84656|nr:RDD family protein [Actinomadura sp. KC216]
MREATLAEPGQRLLARIVDTLIVGVPVMLVVRAVVSGPTVDVVAPPALAGCMLLYEAIQLALWGRTLGKRVAGIEVVVAVSGVAAPAPASQGGGAEASSELTSAPSMDDAEAGARTNAEPGAQTVAEAVTETATAPEEAEPGAEPAPLKTREIGSAWGLTSDTGPGRTQGSALTHTSQEGTRAPTQEDEAWPAQGVGAVAGSGPAAGAMSGAGPEQTQVSETGAGPVLGADLGNGREGESEPTPDAETGRVLIGEQPRLDVVRALVRAAVYSLPIAARPIPAAGLLASMFWLANAAALYEGTRRQAVHDRLIGTLVVKRPPTDSSAF